MDPTLKAILLYVKQPTFFDTEITWINLRSCVLADCYHLKMCLADVMRILMEAYTSALAEPKFELHGQSAAVDLLLAPIVGLHSIDWDPITPSTKYTVEQFYNAMIRKMLCSLRNARIDWCRAELWPEGTETA